MSKSCSSSSHGGLTKTSPEAGDRDAINLVLGPFRGRAMVGLRRPQPPARYEATLVCTFTGKSVIFVSAPPRSRPLRGRPVLIRNIYGRNMYFLSHVKSNLVQCHQGCSFSVLGLTFGQTLNAGVNS